MNIHALLRGFAAELAAAEVKPALGAVAVDGVDHGSDGRSLAVVIALIAVGSRQVAVYLRAQRCLALLRLASAKQRFLSMQPKPSKV